MDDFLILSISFSSLHVTVTYNDSWRILQKKAYKIFMSVLEKDKAKSRDLVVMTIGGNRLTSPPLFMSGINPEDLLDPLAPSGTRRLEHHCRAWVAAAQVQREMVAKRRMWLSWREILPWGESPNTCLARMWSPLCAGRTNYGCIGKRVIFISVTYVQSPGKGQMY